VLKKNKSFSQPFYIFVSGVGPAPVFHSVPPTFKCCPPGFPNPLFPAWLSLVFSYDFWGAFQLLGYLDYADNMWLYCCKMCLARVVSFMFCNLNEMQMAEPKAHRMAPLRIAVSPGVCVIFMNYQPAAVERGGKGECAGDIKSN